MSLKAHESPIIVMAIDQTSSLVATGSADGIIKIWDISGRKIDLDKRPNRKYEWCRNQ